MRSRPGRSVALVIMLALAACSSGPEATEAAGDDGHPGAAVEDPPPTPTPTPTELRRDGEILVFQRPGPDLAAQDPETGEVRKVVETEGIVDCPDHPTCKNFVKTAEWSSDGRWVAFEVAFDGEDLMPDGPCGPTAGLWVQGATSEPRQLTRPCDATPGAEGIDALWAWSPVGDRLAYARVDGATDKLFVIDPSDGSRTLLGKVGSLTALDWSPDGTRIAVAAEGEGVSEIAANQGGMALLGDSFEYVYDIDYSPNGTQIMVRDIDYSRGRDRMQVMNADGSDLHLLLNDKSGFDETEWSPNGDRIVFALSAPSAYSDTEIWTFAPDGSNRIKVFDSDACDMTGTQNGLPVWAPNGTQIAYQACNVWVVANTDGTGEAQPIDRAVHRSWAGGGLSGWDFYSWWG